MRGERGEKTLKFFFFMEEIYFTFETLDVYQKARKLVKDIYQLLDCFPSYEKYSLCDQIRRSAISVPSNLAEGSGRFSLKERIHFVEFSYGSLMEVYCQLSIANDLGYYPAEKHKELKTQIDEISRMLYGLRNSLINKINKAK